MTKELEALKRLRQETCPATYMQDFDKEECCNIIERALLELETIKSAKPSEALENLRICWTSNQSMGEHLADCEYEQIEQALLKAQELEKAWELYLAKPNEVTTAIAYFKSTIKADYKDDYCLAIKKDYLLTEEEFDLLKHYFEKNIQKL